MVTTIKRSITLDADVDRELAKRFPPGERSRFLNDAARQALARVRLAELLDRFDQEDGPIPDDIRAEVAALPLPEATIRRCWAAW